MSSSLALVRGLASRLLCALALVVGVALVTISFAVPRASALPAGAIPSAAVPAGSAQPARDQGVRELGDRELEGNHSGDRARSDREAEASAEVQASSRVAPADSPEAGSSVQLPPTPKGFETTRRGWLQVDVPPSLRHWAPALVKEAESFKAEVNARLGSAGLRRVVVRVAEDARSMVELAPVGAPYPEYAEGVAYSRLGLILLTAEPTHAGQAADMLTTFRHELAHVALHDALNEHRVPLWFNEGLAIHLSRENAFARSQALWTATLSGNLMPLKEIERRFPRDIVGVPLAYAQSADVVRYLLRTHDQERFRLLIKRLARGQAFEAALSDSYGMDLYNLESSWLEDVKNRNTIWPVLLSGTALWSFGVALVVLAWRRKRTRQRTIFARWEKEEALEAERARALLIARAEREAAAAAASFSDAPPPLPTPAPKGSQAGAGSRGGQRDSVPRVEHDGNWHTLH